MIKPGTPEWAELVRVGMLRDGQRNWFLGDAALQIAPMGGSNNGADDVEANLRRYAEEIGVEFEAIRNYRNVASAWPSATRVADTCWKVHQQLAGHKDLMRSGMKVSEAAVALGQRNVGRTGPRSSPEARARQTLDNIGDPVVADYLTKMAKTSTEDLNLQAIAAGGRMPAKAEPQPDALSMIEAVAKDEFALDRLLDQLDQVIAAITERGPVGDATKWAERIRRAQLALLDILVDTPVTR